MLFIHRGYSQLQYCREEDPEQIGDIDEADPMYIRTDGDKCPDERPENEQSIHGGEPEIFQAEFNRRECKIKNKIKDKW